MHVKKEGILDYVSYLRVMRASLLFGSSQEDMVRDRLVSGPAVLAMTTMSAGHSAFFYGILMHPRILLGVISNDGSHLRICPAVLLVSLVCSISHSCLSC